MRSKSDRRREAERQRVSSAVVEKALDWLEQSFPGEPRLPNEFYDTKEKAA